MVVPVSHPFIVTSKYGTRFLDGVRQFHDGIDFIGVYSDIVVSVADGIVTYDMDDYEEAKRWTDPHHSAGNMIIIRHELDAGLFYCRYLHLKNNIVKKGQKVFEGSTLGNYADVGRSRGAHVHFDAYDMHWQKVNPTPLFQDLLGGVS